MPNCQETFRTLGFRLLMRCFRPKVRESWGTFISRSNVCKRLADLHRFFRTSLGRFQTARKLLALWASSCARAASGLKFAKVWGTLRSWSNVWQRLARLPRVCRASLGRFQTARKVLALLVSACACAASDLKCAKVRGTLSSRSNVCKRLGGLPRVCRTSLGRFQTASKLLEPWAFVCACAASDLKCAKFRGTLSSRSNACKRPTGFVILLRGKITREPRPLNGMYDEQPRNFLYGSLSPPHRGNKRTIQKTVDWSPRLRDKKKWNSDEIKTNTQYLTHS